MSVISFRPAKGKGSRQRSAEETNIVAALDVGSTKVSCLIAERMPPRENGAGEKLRIRGSGHQASGGVRAGAVVDIEALRAHKLASKKTEHVKVIAGGELSRKLTLKVNAISAGARQAIESAGGKVETI